MGTMKWNRARAIAALYRGGESLDAIAAKYSISRQRVTIILKEQTGIPVRPRGRPKRAAIVKRNP